MSTTETNLHLILEELPTEELVERFCAELTQRFYVCDDQLRLMNVQFSKVRAVLSDLHDEYERFHPHFEDSEDQGTPVG